MTRRDLQVTHVATRTRARVSGTNVVIVLRFGEISRMCHNANPNTPTNDIPTVKLTRDLPKCIMTCVPFV